MANLMPWSRRETTPERYRHLRDEMNDMFSSIFSGFPSFFGGTTPTEDWLPAIDVKDDEKTVTICAEIPGVDRKDVKIEIHDNVLTLRGEKKEEKKEEKDNWYRRETIYGTFARSVSLPSNVDASKAEAAMDNGVLTIKLPKTEQPRAKQIEIH